MDPVPVSYTHLDVYKRQEQAEERDEHGAPGSGHGIHDPEGEQYDQRVERRALPGCLLYTSLVDAASQVLQGSYRYTENEERLYLSNGKYVKINLASSGQQEAVSYTHLLN